MRTKTYYLFAVLALAVIFAGCVQPSPGPAPTPTPPAPANVTEAPVDASKLIDEPDLLNDTLDEALEELDLFS